MDTIFSRRNRHTLNSANAAARLMHAPVPLHWRIVQRSQYNAGRMYPRGRARGNVLDDVRRRGGVGWDGRVKTGQNVFEKKKRF